MSRAYAEERPIGALIRGLLADLVARADAGKLSEDDVETLAAVHAVSERFREKEVQA